MGDHIFTSARVVTSWCMQENSMEFERQSPPQQRAWPYLSCASAGFVMAVIIFLQNGTSFGKKKKSVTCIKHEHIYLINFLLWCIFNDIKHTAVWCDYMRVPQSCKSEDLNYCCLWRRVSWCVVTNLSWRFRQHFLPEIWYPTCQQTWHHAK